MLFQSFEVAYFTGFVPVKFIPSDLMIYFDTTAVAVVSVFLWVNALTILASHHLQQRSTEMQFNAQCLGKWVNIGDAQTYEHTILEPPTEPSAAG